MLRYYPRQNRMVRHNNHAGFNGGCRLPLDVRAEEDAYVIEAAVPGLTADDLKIEIKDDVLQMRAEMKEDETVEERNYLHREMRYSSFDRSIRVPQDIDLDKVEAKVKNGMLTLRLPRVEEEKPRRIEVKTR